MGASCLEAKLTDNPRCHNGAAKPFMPGSGDIKIFESGQHVLLPFLSSHSLAFFDAFSVYGTRKILGFRFSGGGGGGGGGLGFGGISLGGDGMSMAPGGHVADTVHLPFLLVCRSVPL